MLRMPLIELEFQEEVFFKMVALHLFYRLIYADNFPRRGQTMKTPRSRYAACLVPAMPRLIVNKTKFEKSNKTTFMPYFEKWFGTKIFLRAL